MDEKKKDLLDGQEEKTPETPSAAETPAVQKPGAYASKWTDKISGSLDKILNRKDFTYDINGDALYQQYKDRYVQQGKMAMMDTLGQAAALTGGYGNSYAQMAGQQAYGNYLNGLNDKIPELYQLALDKYSQEGDSLYKQYSLLSAQEGQDYDRYKDGQGLYQQEWENALRLYQLGIETPEVLGILGIPEEETGGGGDSGGSGGGRGGSGGNGGEGGIDTSYIRSEYLDKNSGISQTDKDAILNSAVKNNVITAKDAMNIKNAAKNNGLKNTGSFTKVGGKYPYKQDR